MKTQHAKVIEIADGRWLWAERGTYHGSAAQAQKAILADARRVARGAGILATVIDWEPRSRVGTLAVQIITGKQGKLGATA
jgi:hypothetical protein